MFEGIVDQLRPTMHKCEVFSVALLRKLDAIERAVRDGAKESEFGDRVGRIMLTAAASTPVSLGQVPLDQLWVLDLVWADQAAWTLTLGGAPRFGPTNMSVANGQLVMLPGEEWSFSPPASITNFMVQFTRQYLGEKPKRAHTGAGGPEGLTSALGPPLHEGERDHLPIAAR